MSELTHRIAAVCLLGIAVLISFSTVRGQTAPVSAMAPGEPVQGGSPREIIERTVPPVVALLVDRSITPGQRSSGLEKILRERTDLHALGRIMLGKSWDGVSPAQRDEFVDVFTDYVMGVYVPLMSEYAGQKVTVIRDYPAGKADHVVEIRVSDQRGGAERQVALIAPRLRQIEQEWKVIDVTVEGISIARVFGAQFRPVMESEGMDGLLKQLRAKMATH